MKSILEIKNISKMYRLGVISSTTLSDDIKRLWFNARGKRRPPFKSWRGKQ